MARSFVHSCLVPLLIGALWLGAPTGCKVPAGPGWQADQGEGVKATEQGLYPVRFSGFANTFIRPGTDFADYRTVFVVPPHVTFEREPTALDDNVYASAAYPTDPNFPMSEEQMATFKRYLMDAFRTELGKSDNFIVVDEPRPDSLVVVPNIHDLVLLVPLGQMPGTESIVSRSTAVMTLDLRLLDAKTGEPIAWVIDRTTAEPPGARGVGTVILGDPPTSAVALRWTFSDWARRLRQRIDATREKAEAAGASDASSVVDGGGA